MSSHAKKSVESQAVSDNPNSMNFLTRWIENARFMGGLPHGAFFFNQMLAHDSSLTDLELNTDFEEGTVIQLGSGLILALVFHHVFRRWYTKKQSLNPLYRNFKTLASVGNTVGMAAATFVPFFPAHLQKYVVAVCADVAGLLFGLMAMPYWLIKARFDKTPEEERSQYTRVGAEGWSKYVKTGLVFGAALGQIAGGIFALVTGGNITTSLLLGAGIGGAALGLGSMIIVPLINKLFSRVLVLEKNQKDDFRNNYVRSGMTLGLGVGATIGFVIGTFLFPGIGSVAGMAIGGALVSLISGVVVGSLGKRISVAVHGKTDSDNSWDYATRNASYICSFLGTAIGFFLPIPFGTLLGAAVGNALGWGLGFLVIKAARSICPVEEKAATLPWTQRVATGATVGSIVGAAIGVGLSFVIGPLGMLAGFTLGTSIGGVVGGIVGGLSDRVARKVISTPFRKKTTATNNAVVYSALTTTETPTPGAAPAASLIAPAPYGETDDLGGKTTVAVPTPALTDTALPIPSKRSAERLCLGDENDPTKLKSTVTTTTTVNPASDTASSASIAHSKHCFFSDKHSDKHLDEKKRLERENLAALANVISRFNPHPAC